MIPRSLATHFSFAATRYPVVTLIGPRQSGKTTLAKSCFGDHSYCNLENPELRALAEDDPRTLFRLFPAPVIFDEIQRVPELLSWIQVNVDEERINGNYILTGSHQLSLQESISQSLAGRTALLTLLPLSIRELTDWGMVREKEEEMFTGFLPGTYQNDIPASMTYQNYFHTYVERDVRQMINLKNLKPFENFVRLLAGRVGGQVNLSSLANDTGVTSTTLAQWLSILEASFIIYRLPPYYENFGKRIRKTPKIYFVDVGLACWLLGIESAQQVLRDPLHGNLFENMVVMEAAKFMYNQGKDPKLYFFRDTKGHEVDLLLERQRMLLPVEIKSAMTWNKQFLKNLIWFQENIPTAGRGTIVYAGDMEFRKNNFHLVNYKHFFPAAPYTDS